MGVSLAFLMFVVASSASTTQSSSTPLAPKPGDVVQGTGIVFRLAVPDDVTGWVDIWAGPPSMRVTANGTPYPIVNGSTGFCQASFGADQIAVCVIETTLAPGPTVWYAGATRRVFDPEAYEWSYPYKVDGPYPFTVASVPRICLLERQPGRVVVTPKVAHVGQTVTVTGRGFVAGYPVAVWPQWYAGKLYPPPQSVSGVPPKGRIYLPGASYRVQTRSVLAGRPFRVTFRLPKTFLLDPSWAGRYWAFVAAQARVECLRIPGYQSLGPLRSYGAVFLTNPAFTG